MSQPYFVEVFLFLAALENKGCDDEDDGQEPLVVPKEEHCDEQSGEFQKQAPD